MSGWWSTKFIIYEQLITRRQTNYCMHDNNFGFLLFHKELFVIGMFLKATFYTKQRGSIAIYEPCNVPMGSWMTVDI